MIFRVALAGSPNCGKTALFNALTGSRQKVGNYPGVTVERKEGSFVTPEGVRVELLDLPGTYSLRPRTPDEEITRDVLFGRVQGEAKPNLLLAVADATHLERTLALILELKTLNIPLVLALNMFDLARARGLSLDLDRLSKELGVRAIPTAAPSGEGIRELVAAVGAEMNAPAREAGEGSSNDGANSWADADSVRARFAEVERILGLCTRQGIRSKHVSDRVDNIVLHPVWGSLILVTLLVLLFQSIFSWSKIPAEWIQQGVARVGEGVTSLLGPGALQSLLVDGVISGVGAVLVFLPQILILFLFILLLEDSGYMARAAFLMDRLMGRVGLHGRAFIPLLSSYACAIPGVMAARTIEDRRDRFTTILVAPLMTCSARLPVYTLLIGAFIPDVPVLAGLHSRGLVMVGLYAAGLAMALLLAFVLRRTVFAGAASPLLIELPSYKLPSFKNVWLGLLERAKLFLRRAGTVILSLSVAIWALSSYPKAPAGATEPAIHYSAAGRIGHAIEPLIRPIGFDWRIGIALIPGFTAREVMVGALATVYAIESAETSGEDGVATALGRTLGSSWSLATALSLLVWYILAPQCISTIAVVRRETNSWRWPLLLVGLLTVLAYAASYAVFQLACAFGWGPVG